MILPNMVPASSSVTFQPGNSVSRSCKQCEVTWYGTEDDMCWCCDKPGGSGRLRLFVIDRGQGRQ